MNEDKVKVLVEGYARENSDGSLSASCTTSVIMSNDKVILVDPGTNKKLLEEALDKEGIDEIDMIFLTHFHPDHFLNISMFPGIPVLDGETIFTDDKELFYEDVIPGTTIKVVKTPGHTFEEVSLVVESKVGVVVVAQDVFWWMDGEQKSDTVEELLAHKDPFAVDAEALLESRKKVMEIADWIVPGHGKMFSNPAKKG